MANVDPEITVLRAAVLDADLRGSKMFTTSVTVKDNTLTSPAVSNLRPGQGVIVGPETFTIESVNTTTNTATLNRRTDIPGTSTGSETSYKVLFTDSNLLNLKNVDGVDVFSIDPTGAVIRHNGLALMPSDGTVTLDHVRVGGVTISTATAALNFTAAQLGRINTLHSAVFINTTENVVPLNDVSGTKLKDLDEGLNNVYFHILPGGSIKAY
ncbi:hypothetical protein GHT06_003842 [Daphnia sinensis]|uniref:Uncharacterized protein n=1 Tax=Daphnia sinensis TaxID=1820382 RepID=A0AAD5KTU5_9CRUS|nr:hypothetical protein GHT06_003842 [Daphnia sinensis]